jgi:hypothetical protein
MKIGDMVGWRSDLMYGLPDENPMIVVRRSGTVEGMVFIVSPSTMWSDWVSIDELSVISSGGENE